MVRNLLFLYDRSVSSAIDRLASQLALNDVNIKAVLIAVTRSSLFWSTLTPRPINWAMTLAWGIVVPAKKSCKNAIQDTCPLIFVFCFILLKGFALKCHFCSSTKSWEDCERVHGSSTIECSEKEAVCYKVHYSTNDGSFNQHLKSCGPESYCKKDANPVCKGHHGTSNCDINCCDENLCNTDITTGQGATNSIRIEGVFLSSDGNSFQSVPR